MKITTVSEKKNTDGADLGVTKPKSQENLTFSRWFDSVQSLLDNPERQCCDSRTSVREFTSVNEEQRNSLLFLFEL